MNKCRKIIFALSLVVILACGFFAAGQMAASDPTYDGRGTDVIALYENPAVYDNSNADGAAAIIVNENLEKTAAANVVYSVVFNFRGYDTLGESFILIGALAGTLVILRGHSNKNKQEGEH